MNGIALLRPIALASLLCAAAYGQTMDRLDVELTGSCAHVPNSILAVVDGRNDGPRVKLTKDEGCHWSGPTFPFDPRLTHFSLRLGMDRSDCHRTENTGGSVGHLKFRCCDAHRSQRVTIDPPVAYLRRVERSKSEPRGVDCAEHGFGRAIDDVQFSREMVSLYLAEARPDPKMPGMLINHPSVIKDAATKGGHRLLTRADLLFVLNAQRRETSPNESELDEKKLREAGVRKLDLTVQ